MNIHKFSELLKNNPSMEMHIMFPNGDFVPAHFHVTEVGKVNKKFIDCGGTKRETTACVLQVWFAHDVNHRLKSDKLAKIINLADSLLGTDDMPLEIEYGQEHISQYPVGNVEITPKGLLIILGSKRTECLAPDKCGVGNCC